MSREDKEVITMVNAPHEARARQHRLIMAQAQREYSRRHAAVRAILRLVFRVELCILAVGLLTIAIGNGWLADWLGAIAIAFFNAAGALQILCYIRG